MRVKLSSLALLFKAVYFFEKAVRGLFRNGRDLDVSKSQKSYLTCLPQEKIIGSSGKELSLRNNLFYKVCWPPHAN